MSKLETAFIVNKNIKHKNVNKLLWRPTHSRQDIDKNDKYSIKEINKNNLDLEIPMHKNDLYNNFTNYTDKPIINEEPQEIGVNVSDEQDTNVEEELEPQQVEEENEWFEISSAECFCPFVRSSSLLVNLTFVKLILVNFVLLAITP